MAAAAASIFLSLRPATARLPAAWTTLRLLRANAQAPLLRRRLPLRLPLLRRPLRNGTSSHERPRARRVAAQFREIQRRVVCIVRRVLVGASRQ